MAKEAKEPPPEEENLDSDSTLANDDDREDSAADSEPEELDSLPEASSETDSQDDDDSDEAPARIKKKQRTKLGKEIILDSQRAEKQKRPLRKRRGVGDTTDAPPQPRRKSKAPIAALAGGVLLVCSGLRHSTTPGRPRTTPTDVEEEETAVLP